MFSNYYYHYAIYYLISIKRSCMPNLLRREKSYSYVVVVSIFSTLRRLCLIYVELRVNSFLIHEITLDSTTLMLCNRIPDMPEILLTLNC